MCAAPSRQPDAPSVYGQQWDWYVENWSALQKPVSDSYTWPGDEWGDAEMWELLFKMMFVPAGVQSWQRAVEVGPGSGKYTAKVLSNSNTALRAYDVSSRFLDICRERCREHIESGRLSTHLLEGALPNEIAQDLEACDWKRKLDGFFSIDVMVHVNLQYLIAYLITAATALKPQGKLVMTFANAASEAGFNALVGEIPVTWNEQIYTHRAGKFEWLSPDLVENILGRLGFELDLFHHMEDSHYIAVVATLARPEDPEQVERYINAPLDAPPDDGR